MSLYIKTHQLKSSQDVISPKWWFELTSPLTGGNRSPNIGGGNYTRRNDQFTWSFIGKLLLPMNVNGTVDWFGCVDKGGSVIRGGWLYHRIRWENGLVGYFGRNKKKWMKNNI